MMLHFNPDKKNCTGCAACYSVCPVRCITMEADAEGFLYPTASDACIGCNACEKVCPQLQPKPDNSHRQKAYAALTHDKDIWRRSSSGGAFSEICRQWADAEALIVGAAWDGLRVHHIGVKGFSQTEALCKSKYVGSAIEDTFIEIKGALADGRKVIFCGCPCQVAGLKAFLRKDHANLLTIDLICHGAGSPKVFKACIESISDHLGERVTAYQFRAKRRHFETDYLTKLTTEKRTHYVVKDPYMQLFLSQNALRPSCGKNCKYRDARRPGDITLADFKGLTQVFPDLTFQKRNWSTIVSNTEKGDKAIALLGAKMELRPCRIDDITKFNPLFARQTWFSEDRDAFFRDFKADSQQAIAKWTSPLTVFRPSAKDRLISLMPSGLARLVFRIYKSLKDRLPRADKK